MNTTIIKSLFASLALCTSSLVSASIITYDFTTCGATGASGPSQAACNSAYTGTTLDGEVTVSSGIQNWAAPTAGLYQITAYGAQGASADPSYSGGRGASVSALFELDFNQVLQILAGQQGQVSDNNGSGGGGGGSFVVDILNNPLLVAGGGGGTRASVSQNGHDASITQYGTTGSQSATSGGGVIKNTGLGLGGDMLASSWGSAGAGFYGDGANDGIYGTGGSSWANGMLGGTIGSSCSGVGANGGFGGGGSGHGCWGGGGGGGYSGGDGGRVAGGGGSFLSGEQQSALRGVGFGDGYVSISLIEDYRVADVPEPSTLAIFALGILGLVSRKLKK
ncbi:glycine-rich protein [Thalassotalea sp. PLHSN55]|uniref:glycine-rich protein n=1 Tax=Thalassotalea sp. PLHSN55 TaxID=3435888 RepID=UPI003F85FAD9